MSNQDTVGWLVVGNIFFFVAFLIALMMGIKCCDQIDGTEGRGCYPNATCDHDLVCYQFDSAPDGICYPSEFGGHVLLRR